jgi:hypothetical protein
MKLKQSTNLFLFKFKNTKPIWFNLDKSNEPNKIRRPTKNTGLTSQFEIKKTSLINSHLWN